MIACHKNAPVEALSVGLVLYPADDNRCCRTPCYFAQPGQDRRPAAHYAENPRVVYRASHGRLILQCRQDSPQVSETESEITRDPDRREAILKLGDLAHKALTRKSRNPILPIPHESGMNFYSKEALTARVSTLGCRGISLSHDVIVYRGP
jgi:hypothetical protein